MGRVVPGTFLFAYCAAIIYSSNVAVIYGVVYRYDHSVSVSLSLSVCLSLSRPPFLFGRSQLSVRVHYGLAAFPVPLVSSQLLERAPMLLWGGCPSI